MIRVSLIAATDREKVAEAVQKDLAAGNRKAVRLQGDELEKALREENWRVKERVGELSAIEFRTLALDRVKAFARDEKLADEAAGKLLELAVKEWDRLSKTTETKEAPPRPQSTDWTGRFSRFAEAVGEGAKELLTVEQRQRLSQALASRPGLRGRQSPPVAEGDKQ
jgi:hypothetical protein